MERLQAWRALQAAHSTFIPLEPICTGIPAFDAAMGGGLARGQIYEIYGPESSGKTTLGLFLSRCVQEHSGVCVWVDADRSLDARYAATCGIRKDHFFVSESANLEQSLQIIETLAASGAVDWLVVDSLTALPLEAELRGKFSDDFLIQRDEFIRHALHHLGQTLQRSRATVLFISQTRHRSGHIYQSDQASTASLALILRSAARFELASKGLITKNGQVVGQRIQIRIVKHFTAPIFLTNSVDIMYNLDIH
jgi:recombination protein RecA